MYVCGYTRVCGTHRVLQPLFSVDDCSSDQLPTGGVPFLTAPFTDEVRSHFSPRGGGGGLLRLLQQLTESIDTCILLML